MRREFLLNIAFLVGINLLIKPLYIFGIDLRVQNLLGSSAYGLFAALFSLSYILQIVNDAGLQQFNNQSIAQDRSLLRHQYARLTGLKVILAGAYILLCLSIALSIGYGMDAMPLLFHIAVNQVLLSWILFLRSNISGLGLYRRDSVISVLDKALMLTICGILLYHPALSPQFTLSWFVWAQTVSFLLTILLARRFLKGQGLAFRWTVQWATIRPLVQKSLPFALAVLLMGAYTRLDTVLLERLLPDGEHQAGVYYMAYRLLDAANNLALLFAALLLPMLARMLSTGEDIHPLVLLGTRLLLAGSMVAAAAIAGEAGPVILFLYPDAPPEAIPVLRWLIWAFVPVSMMYIFATLLTAGARLDLMNRILLATVALNLGLLFWLIPTQGVLGAAVTTLVTQSAVAVAMMIASFRVMPLRFTVRESASLILFTILMVLPVILPWGEAWPWEARMALMVAGGLILASLLGLLPMSEFLKLMRARAGA